MKGQFIMKSKTFLCLSVCILNATLAFAQPVGTISGQVKDAITGEPLPGANVVIVGNSMGAAAGPNGIYIIPNVPPNTYSISASFLSYQTVTKPQITVLAGSTTRADFQLLAVGPPRIYPCMDTCIIIRAKQPDPDTLVIRLQLCNELRKTLTNVEAEINEANVLFCGEGNSKFKMLKKNVFYGNIDNGSCAPPNDTCATNYRSEFRYTTTELDNESTERCLHFYVRVFYKKKDCRGDEDESKSNDVRNEPSCYHLEIPAKNGIVQNNSSLIERVIGVGAFLVIGFFLGRL